MKVVTQLQTTIQQALNDLDFPFTGEIHVEHPADISHGDYATNIALTLSGELKKNPRDLAEQITNQIKTNLNSDKVNSEGKEDALGQESFISKIEIAGPGFINFSLSDAFLVAEMGSVIQNKATPPDSKNKGKKAVVEYSSPNIAKPFTIGHLRSTIIGDAIANLLEATGYEVYRDNHLGDWGTQFGKQIYALKNLGAGSLDENIEIISKSDNPVKELVKLYVEFHEKAEDKPELDDLAREWFKKLEDGNKEARELWQMCIDWSWVEFDKIYKKLGIKFTENQGRGYGESYFEDKMGTVLKELEGLSDGISYDVGENGAKLVNFPEASKLPPMMILKSDGATLYATRDLATDKWRLEEKYGKDTLIVNEVGAEQTLYFRQLFAIEKALGWTKDSQRVHVGHGLYRFKDGKMSTRKGNVIWLEDVLKEAVQKAEKLADPKREMDAESLQKIAFGALKWSDLKRNTSLDLTFDWDAIMTMQGNSGPYLQYTFVRCNSILKKAKNISSPKPFDTLSTSLIDQKLQITPSERDLLRNLYTYSEVVEKAALEYAPHHLTTYLFALAQSFNKFYGASKVVGSEAEVLQLRLSLVKATSQILQKGLGILGIEVVEKM
jgi:arginyl-tRNA synthetase